MHVSKIIPGIAVMLALCACAAQQPWMNDRLPPQVAQQHLPIDQAECNANAWHVAERITTTQAAQRTVWLSVSRDCMGERGWRPGGAQASATSTAPGVTQWAAACGRDNAQTRCIVISGHDLVSCWDRTNVYGNLDSFCLQHGGTFVHEVFWLNAGQAFPPTLCGSQGTFEDHGSTTDLHYQRGTCDNGNHLAGGDASCRMSEDSLVCQAVEKKNETRTYQRTKGVELQP
jgi:hypothetical protein